MSRMIALADKYGRHLQDHETYRVSLGDGHKIKNASGHRHPRQGLKNSPAEYQLDSSTLTSRLELEIKNERTTRKS
jgi:hypothetical protein